MIMIVYGDHKETLTADEYFNNTESTLHELELSGFKGHNSTVELLISTGIFEAALIDHLSEETDRNDHFSGSLRELSLEAGHVFLNSLEGNTEAVKMWTHSFSEKLQSLKSLPLPSPVISGVPEGYAYYSLYPEMYVRSAMKFFEQEHPVGVTVIGIRSIGTSLSAVTAALLIKMGCSVTTFSVRPRGFFFSRKLSLSANLEELIRSQSGNHFLIVDEGPGLSGSSLCSTADKLSSLGVPRDRIILFPSWNSDGSSFVSEESRLTWQMHKKYVTDFEHAVNLSSLLPANLTCESIQDISAGSWRSMFYKNSDESPAIYRNFEQRKYLCTIASGKVAPESNGAKTGSKILLKFAGLGIYGRLLFERAQKLAAAGFSPIAYGINNGFISFEFIDGMPLSIIDACKELLDYAAEYISFLKNSFPARRTRSFDEMYEMIIINLTKGLGKEWAERYTSIAGWDPEIFSAPATAVDGRMLPHEWLRAPAGFIKTDSLHHHKDHFFPGCQDIAWDIAGFCTEFRLNEEARGYFLDRYASISGDRSIYKRLPYYNIAYPAFRLGYAVLCSEMLGPGDPEGQKFRVMANIYSSILQSEICLYS